MLSPLGTPSTAGRTEVDVGSMTLSNAGGEEVEVNIGMEAEVMWVGRMREEEE